MQANFVFFAFFVFELGVRTDKRTDGLTDERAGHVMQPISTAAQYTPRKVLFFFNSMRFNIFCLFFKFLLFQLNVERLV